MRSTRSIGVISTSDEEILMQCAACKTKLDEDSTHCHHCGRSLEKGRKLDLFLDLGLAMALVTFSWVVLLWLGFWFSLVCSGDYDAGLYSLWNGHRDPGAC